MTILVREITYLYNRILQTGVFPDRWKIASVTPIPKVANAKSPTDLRPISLLPIPGKLLEKLITSKIQNYLENKNSFGDNQNGIRKGKSTSSALTTFLDDIISGLNDSKTSIVAYLDFQKAFDTINHKILLNKLKRAGLGVKLLSLLENYLSGRKQKTKVHGATSELMPISVGVPQGSTLGPIMFIVYINNLTSVLQHCKCLMYADDTVLYCSHDKEKSVRKSMQSDLDKIQAWCFQNRLTLNVKKTKIMTFMSDHKRKRYKKFRMFMIGKDIEEVENYNYSFLLPQYLIYKYLGTEIDNKWGGDEQFSKLTQMLGYKLSTFGKIRRHLTIKAALAVYKSMVLPVIDYNDHFQFLWNKNKVDRLQKYQN